MGGRDIARESARHHLDCGGAVRTHMRNGRVRTVWSGPASDNTGFWQDESTWAYGSGSAYRPGGRRCVDRSGYAWWELWLFAEGDPTYSGVWVPFSPYPGKVLSYQGCIDLF